MWDINYGEGFKPDLDMDAENNKCHRKMRKNEGGNDSK